MGGGGINTVKVSPLLVTVGVAGVVFTEGATVCLDGLLSGTLVGTTFSGEELLAFDKELSDSFSLFFSKLSYILLFFG